MGQVKGKPSKCVSSALPHYEERHRFDDRQHPCYSSLLQNRVYYYPKISFDLKLVNVL